MKKTIALIALCLVLLLQAGCSSAGSYEEIYAKAYADAYASVYGANPPAPEQPLPAVSSDGSYSAAEIFQNFCPGVVHLETSNGGGTGFFLEENVIATNNHVIDGAGWITARTQDGQIYPVTTVLARSVQPDLALLQIDGSGTPLNRNTHEIREGDPLYCIGAPMGIYPCISDGIVMKRSHIDADVEYILSNYHSIGGNSGGPVLNAYGEVVGVVVGGMSDGPNSIDMVIHGKYLDTLDRSAPEAILTKDEYTAEMNKPEEEKYEHASLADAQPGQLVSLGRYEQDGDESNGAEEIFWLVMERNGSSLTLMSLYCLDAGAYHNEACDITWENSHIRQFLNDTFFTAAFDAGEQAYILESTVTNPANPNFGTPGGNETTDKVYLPSLEEIMRWYDIAEPQETAYPQLYAVASKAATQKGVWLEMPDTNRCWWWLRSPGGNPSNVCEVGSFGYLSFNGNTVTIRERGLRPVIQVSAP